MWLVTHRAQCLSNNHLVVRSRLGHLATFTFLLDVFCVLGPQREHRLIEGFTPAWKSSLSDLPLDSI